MRKARTMDRKTNGIMRLAILITLMISILLPSCSPVPEIPGKEPGEPLEKEAVYVYRSADPAQGVFSKAIITFKTEEGVTAAPVIFEYNGSRRIELGKFTPGKSVPWHVSWYDDDGILLAEDSGNISVAPDMGNAIRLDLKPKKVSVVFKLEGLEDMKAFGSDAHVEINADGHYFKVPLINADGCTGELPVGMHDVTASFGHEWAWKGKISVSALEEGNVVRIPLKKVLSGFKLKVEDHRDDAASDSYRFRILRDGAAVEGYEVSKVADGYEFMGLPLGSYHVIATAYSPRGDIVGESAETSVSVSDSLIGGYTVQVWSRLHDVDFNTIYPIELDGNNLKSILKLSGPDGVTERGFVSGMRVPEGDYDAVIEVYDGSWMMADGSASFSVPSDTSIDVPMEVHGRHLEVDIPGISALHASGKIDEAELSIGERTYTQKAESFTPWIFDDIYERNPSLSLTLRKGNRRYFYDSYPDLNKTDKVEFAAEILDGYSSVEIIPLVDGKNEYCTWTYTLTHESGETFTENADVSLKKSGLAAGKWKVECSLMLYGKLWGSGTVETVLSPDAHTSVVINAVPVLSSLKVRHEDMLDDVPALVRLYSASDALIEEVNVRPGTAETLFENLRTGEYRVDFYYPGLSQKPVGSSGTIAIGGGEKAETSIAIRNDLRFRFCFDLPVYSDGSLVLELTADDGTQVLTEKCPFDSSHHGHFEIPVNVPEGFYNAAATWYEADGSIVEKQEFRASVNVNSEVSRSFGIPKGYLVLKFQVPETCHSDEVAVFLDNNWSWDMKWSIADIPVDGIWLPVRLGGTKNVKIVTYQNGVPFREETYEEHMELPEEIQLTVSLGDPDTLLTLVPDFKAVGDNVVSFVSRLEYTVDGNQDFHAVQDLGSEGSVGIKGLAPGKHTVSVSAWNDNGVMVNESLHTIDVPGLISEVSIPIEIDSSWPADFSFTLAPDFVHFDDIGDIALQFMGPGNRTMEMTVPKDRLQSGISIENMAFGEWTVTIKGSVRKTEWSRNSYHDFCLGCPLLDSSASFFVKSGERNAVSLELSPATVNVSFAHMEAENSYSAIRGHFRAESPDGLIKIDEWVEPGTSIAVPKWEYVYSYDVYSGDTLLSEGSSRKRAFSEDFSLSPDYLIGYPLDIMLDGWEYSDFLSKRLWHVTVGNHEYTIPESGRLTVFGEEGIRNAILSSDGISKSFELRFSKETAGTTVSIPLEPRDVTSDSMIVELAFADGVVHEYESTYDITVKYPDGSIMTQKTGNPTNGLSYVSVFVIPARMDIEMVMRNSSGVPYASGKIIGLSGNDVRPEIKLCGSYAEPEVILSAPESTAARVEAMIIRDGSIILKRTIAGREESAGRLPPGRYTFAFVSYDGNGRITDGSLYGDEIPSQTERAPFSPRPATDSAPFSFRCPGNGMEMSGVADILLEDADGNRIEIKDVEKDESGNFSFSAELPFGEYRWTVSAKKDESCRMYDFSVSGTVGLDDPTRTWILLGDVAECMHSLVISSVLPSSMGGLVPAGSKIIYRVEDSHGNHAEKEIPTENGKLSYECTVRDGTNGLSGEGASRVSCMLVTADGTRLASGENKAFTETEGGWTSSIDILPGEVRLKADQRYLGHLRDSNGGFLELNMTVHEGTRTPIAMKAEEWDPDMNELVIIPFIPDTAAAASLDVELLTEGTRIAAYEGIPLQDNHFTLPEERPAARIKAKTPDGPEISSGFDIEVLDPHGHYGKKVIAASDGPLPLSPGDWSIKAVYKASGRHYAGAISFTLGLEGEKAETVLLEPLMMELGVSIRAESSLGIPAEFLLERMDDTGKTVLQSWSIPGSEATYKLISDAWMEDGPGLWRLTGLDGTGKPFLRETVIVEQYEKTDLVFSLTNEDILK